MTITKLDLINIRGCRCEICKASRWKQKSIATGLVVTRKDRTKPRTEDNLLLICRMCYCEKGYNKHTPHKRRTFAEVEAAVRASIAASTPAPLIDQSNYFNTQAGK